MRVGVTVARRDAHGRERGVIHRLEFSVLYRYSEERKEYDRQRAAKVYEDFKARKAKLVAKFGGRCAGCSTTNPKRGDWHLHHTSYTDESNYPRNSKAMSTRIKRLEEAERNPERFRMLCPRCHHIVTVLQSLHSVVRLNLMSIAEL